MIYTNGGFALGTYSGATLTKTYTMVEDGYFVLALSRKIPDDVTTPNLSAPTGFTTLSERACLQIDPSYSSSPNKAAIGLYIKQCVAGESISVSLPPDSRIITPTERIHGDIIGIEVNGADSYEFDINSLDQIKYEKKGEYSAIYIAAGVDDTPLYKDGSSGVYSSRYTTMTTSSGDFPYGGGYAGLLGGFSQYKSRGVDFSNPGYSYGILVYTYEIKFIDEETILENPKKGAIIRNGVIYGADPNKTIPSYNGTFINDFKIKYLYYNQSEEEEDSFDVIKFTVPSGVKNGNNYYPSIEIGRTDICFSNQWRNIGPANTLYDSSNDYNNIIIAGSIVPHRMLENDYPQVIEEEGYNTYSTDNIILGNNILTSYDYDRWSNNVIIGQMNVSKAQTSSWANWIIGCGNSINNNGYGNVFCGGKDNHYDIGYNYGFPNVILGGYNTITNENNETSVEAFIGGAHNLLEVHAGGQNIIGLSNEVINYVNPEANYKYQGNIYSDSDSNSRYGFLVTGRSNIVRGGISLCAGYANTIEEDVAGYNNTSTNLNFFANNLVLKTRMVVGTNNQIASTLAVVGDFTKVTNGALLVLGEHNTCNETNSPLTTWITTNEKSGDIYKSLVCKSSIIGSYNKTETSGITIGFGNTVYGANTTLGSFNTITNGTIGMGNVYGDSNNVSSNTGDVFGSNNTVSNGGCHVYGNGNTVNGGSYCVGFGNTVINGSAIFGSSNNTTGGSSWKVIGFNNTLQSGGGPVIGNGNTFNSGNMTYGILGYNNTVNTGGAAFGCGNRAEGGSNAIGYGNTLNSGTTAIGTNNRVTGGGGHYILGTNNEANTTSAQIIGFSNTVSAGLAIGNNLSVTGTNVSCITLGAFNNPAVDASTRVTFGDGTSTSNRHNLFTSDYNSNVFFSGNIYGTNLPDAPNTAGTYMLQCVVTVDPDTSEVSKSYSWV